MTIEHEELQTLLPHRGKMFIVGRISEANLEAWSVESETKITEDFMFYDKEACGVPNYACFEIIAQTVASLSGLYSRENGLKPRMGFVLSVSNLKFDFDKINAGQTVKIKAFRETEMESVSSFCAEIYIDGNLVGGGKLTAMTAGDSDVKQEN